MDIVFPPGTDPEKRRQDIGTRTNPKDSCAFDEEVCLKNGFALYFFLA